MSRLMHKDDESHLRNPSMSVALPAMSSRHFGQMHGERPDLRKVKLMKVMFMLSVAVQVDSLACLTHQVAVPALEDPGGRRQLLKTHLGMV